MNGILVVSESEWVLIFLVFEQQKGFPLGCSVPQTLEMANGDTFDFPFMQSANQTPCVCTKSNYYLLCAFNWKLFQITGGGNGIGKAIAFELARHGCKIAIVDIDHQAAMTTANAVKKMHVVDVRGYCVSGRLHQSIDRMNVLLYNYTTYYNVMNFHLMAGRYKWLCSHVHIAYTNWKWYRSHRHTDQ